MNTMQQEFDIVVAHLFKQGKPAKKLPHKDGCVYRSSDGSMCAVGCRIPDNIYNPKMDIAMGTCGDTDVSSLIQDYADVLPAEIVMYEDMFERLQSVHDTCKTDAEGMFDVNNLNEKLTWAASKLNLEFKPEAYASN